MHTFHSLLFPSPQGGDGGWGGGKKVKTHKNCESFKCQEEGRQRAGLENYSRLGQLCKRC